MTDEQKDDPLEELTELYTELSEMEKRFKRVLEICSKLSLNWIGCCTV